MLICVWVTHALTFTLGLALSQTFALLCAVRYFGDSKFIVAGAGVGGNPAASGVKTTRFDFIALAVLLE